MALRFAGWAAALVAGALPALAFPAPSWWWLAWFGVVPLLLVVRAAPKKWIFMAQRKRAGRGKSSVIPDLRSAAVRRPAAVLMRGCG